MSFRDIGFQVKEILDIGRKRTHEFKSKLEAVKSASRYSELLESYTPKQTSFSEIINYCRLRAEQLLLQSKYGILECQKIDLLYYYNLLDIEVTHPANFKSNKIGFRSLSVVSNNYCAVVYASSAASELLKNNAEIVREWGSQSMVTRHSQCNLLPILGGHL